MSFSKGLMNNGVQHSDGQTSSEVDTAGQWTTMEDSPRRDLCEVRYRVRAHELMDINGPVAETLREYFISLVKERAGKCLEPTGKKGINKIGPIVLTWRNKPEEKRLTTWIHLYPERQEKIYRSGNVDDWDIQLLVKAIKAVLDYNCQTSVKEEEKTDINQHIDNSGDDRNTVAHCKWSEKEFKEIVQRTENAIHFLLSTSARMQEILAWVKDVERGVCYVLDDTPLHEYRKALKNTVMAHVKAKGIAFEDSVSKCFPDSSDGNDAHMTLFGSIDNSSMDEKVDGFAKFIKEIQCEKKVQDIDKRYREKKAELIAVSTVQLKLKEDHQNPPMTWATMHRGITKVLQEKGYENPRIELISMKRGCIELIFTMSQMTALSLPSILVEPGETRELADLMKKIGNPVVTLFECLQLTPKDRRYEPTFLGTKYMQEDILALYSECQDKLKSQSADPKLLDNLKKSQDIVDKLSPKMPEESEEERSEEPQKPIAGQKRKSRDTSPLEVSPPKKPKKKLPKTSKGMMSKKFEVKTTRTRSSKRRRRV